MKKIILILILLCPITIFGQGLDNKEYRNRDVIEKFIRLSSQQLYDTANYFLDLNDYDTALMCYNLLINTIPKNADIEMQNILQNAYNRAAYVYISFSDYRIAYDYLIKRLLICEKYNLNAYMIGTYMNIGYVYFYLNQYQMSKQYLLKALELTVDSAEIVLILNNLGATELVLGQIDSSFYYTDKALKISRQHNDIHLCNLLNNLGTYYQKEKQYDSAFYYLKSSLELAKKDNLIEKEAIYLSDIGNLFFEVNKKDSALHYINLSNNIALENKYLKILTENYFTLSEIEKSKGRFENALNFHNRYTNLKDSIYNADVFGSVYQVQRLYEISKTNQLIEELEIDSQIKENKIYYQKIILNIVLGVLGLVFIVLIIIIRQKRDLNRAYKSLVDKNIEIVELQDNSSKKNKKKASKTVLNDNAQNDLLEKILHVMDDVQIICDSEFTVDQLAKTIKSNQLYVSQAINDGLKMNFRSLLNKYRILEAQKLLSDSENTKFTIEFIAHKVGFKSQSAFREAFKDITGVNPNFYLKSIKVSG